MYELAASSQVAKPNELYVACMNVSIQFEFWSPHHAQTMQPAMLSSLWRWQPCGKVAARCDFFMNSLLYFSKFLVYPNMDLELKCVFRKPTNRRLQWHIGRTEIYEIFSRRRNGKSNTCNTHTHNQFMALCDNPGEPVSEETFTHSHLTWSWIIPYASFIYYDPRHALCSIYVTVFSHNLSLSFLWSTSWPGTLHFKIHTFLHPIIVFFSQHMPMPSQPVLL